MQSSNRDYRRKQEKTCRRTAVANLPLCPLRFMQARCFNYKNLFRVEIYRRRKFRESEIWQHFSFKF